MKLSKLFIVALSIMLIAGYAFSQARQSQIEIYAGAAFPMAPDEFKDYFKMGYSLHGQYVMFPSPKLGISVGLGYEPFSVDEDKFIEDITGYSSGDLDDMGIDYEMDLGLSIMELCVGVRPYLSAPEATTQLFAFGMATYNIMKFKSEGSISYYDYYDQYYYEESFDETETENKFGLAVGGGMEMPLTDTMNLIFQGLYRFIFTEEENTNFLGVTAGIIF